MAIPASPNQVSLSDLYDEFTGTHSTQEIQLSDYHDEGNAPASGEIQLAADFHGTSATSPAAMELDMDASNDGDHLLLTHADAFDFGTNDFTLEGWFRSERTHAGGPTSGWRAMFALMTGAGVDGYGGNIWIRHNSEAIEWNWNNSAGGVLFDWMTSNSQPQTSSPSTWFHFAAVMDGGTAEMFIDGVSGGTASRNGTCVDASGLRIGVSTSGTADWQGWIDEIRISNNARYTSNFNGSLPTSGFTSDDNTIVLLHMDGDNNGQVFTNSASGTAAKTVTITVGDDAKTNTSYGIGTTNDVTN